MVILILENGQMIEPMVMEFIDKAMELYMKDIGEMINNMERERRNVII